MKVRTRLMTLAILAAVSLGFSGRASAAVIANSVTDFSDTQGANGWSYRLWYAPQNWQHDLPVWNSNSWWEGSGRVWNEGMHPHSTDWYVVREWTSNYAGTVSITGDALLYNAEAAGVILNVFNGYDASQSLWTATLAGGDSATMNVTTDVTVGQKLLFAIIGNGAISSDNTGWAINIATVPEPAAMLLLGFGLAGALWRRR